MKSYIKNAVYLVTHSTGSSINNDKIIKLDAIKILDNSESVYSTFINVSSINFYYNDLNSDILNLISTAPNIAEILPDFRSFIGDFPIITYNNLNQVEFLKLAFKDNSLEFNNKILDCFELFILLEPWHNNYSLLNLLDKKYNLNKSSLSIVAMDLVNLLNSFLEDNDIGDFISHYGSYLKKWNFENYLVNFNISEEILKDKSVFKNSNLFLEGKKHLKLQEDCENLLKSKNGFSSINNKFKFRQGQYDVMKAVRNGLDKNFISIIEAPTGTGKSIAYLLPSITNTYFKGQKIFISTNTKELQKQLIHKDIPFLFHSFGLLNEVNVLTIKGKSNYLCMDIIQSHLNDNVYNKKSLKENMSLVYLHKYCYKGKAGDKEEISDEIIEFLNLNELMSSSSCDSDGCNIKACPYECYYKNIVNSLKTSTIIILNHSLLLKWPYETIMEHVIIDEAHNLSDAIFDAYASTLNSKEIKSLLLEILDYKNRKGYLNYIWKYTPNRVANFRELIRDKIDTCFLSIDRISFLAYKEQKDFYNLDVTFTKENFYSYNKITHELLILKENLIDFYKPLKKFIDGNNLDNSVIKNRGEILMKKVDRVKELIDLIDVFTTLEQDKDKCYGFFIEKNQKFWECYIKDLNSSIIFFERFLNTLKSCTFLSATLKNNSSYRNFKNSLSLEKTNTQYLKELTNIANSFDLKNRTLIYSPTDCPKYFEHNFIDFMVKGTLEIADKSNSNILILFTSKRRLLEFEKKISPYLTSRKINLFNKKQDLKKLSINEKSILLGSKGFFEGIDIPGDLLNIVLMDKMPNINPHSPLFEKFLKNGYNFNSLNTPRAATTLKQCFGRLIRTEYDYGYFIIFDKCKQNTVIENMVKEYNNVKFISKPFNTLTLDIEKRFKHWSIMNFSSIIKNTLKDLEDHLESMAKKIDGNSQRLEFELNKFYEKKLKELNLKKRIHLSTKNKRLLLIYDDTSEINILEKGLITSTINKVFTK